MSPRIFANFNDAGDQCGVSSATIRNWVVKGDLPAFKLPGKKGHYVDLAEAKALATKRQQWGTFGPEAKVIDLTNVVEDFEVLG